MKLGKFLRSLFSCFGKRRSFLSIEKPPSIELNQLPDLCLIAIFTRLPLNDLITIGLICERWKSLVPGATNRIRSLTIVVDGWNYAISSRFIYPHAELLKRDKTSSTLLYDRQVYSKWNTLKFEIAEFNQSLAEQITITFPKIESLELTYFNIPIESIEPLAHLLNHWHSQLISIKLFLQRYQLDLIYPIDCSLLIFSIIQAPSPLKSLTLELSGFVSIDKRLSPSIIAQLEKFCYYYEDIQRDWSDRSEGLDFLHLTMQYILNSSNLRQLGLRYNENLPESKLRNRITHLAHQMNALKSKYLNTNKLEDMCSNFPALTSVLVEINKRDLYAILTPLSKLQNLTFLQLKIRFGNRQLRSQEELDEYMNQPLKPYMLPVVPSVTILQLNLRDLNLASEFIELNIAYHFYSVQVIELNISEPLPIKEEKCKIYDHLAKKCSELHHLFDDSVVVWYKEEACAENCDVMYRHAVPEQII